MRNFDNNTSIRNSDAISYVRVIQSITDVFRFPSSSYQPKTNRIFDHAGSMNLLTFLVCVERALLQSYRQFLLIRCRISSMCVQPKFAIGLVCHARFKGSPVRQAGEPVRGISTPKQSLASEE